MKRAKWIVAAVVAAAGLISQAQASLIQYGAIVTIPHPLGNQEQEAAFVSELVGIDLEVCTNLDKIELQGENAFWDISWDLTGTGDALLYVLVKGGASSGTQGIQLYNLYEVSDDQQVVGSGRVTVNGSKAISHITFLCAEDGTTVPDGGATALLLGSAVAVLGIAKRRLR